MATKISQPREGEDFNTYRGDYRGRNNPTWHHYCLLCNSDAGRGTSLTRKDARDKARTHVTKSHR